ncbi:subtilisin-like protein [Auricularia subglabra TFB-10046 SS5]|nr:subtilisin-like protein [Auricularia subglabra TFB-10046 SS5]
MVSDGESAWQSASKCDRYPAPAADRAQAKPQSSFLTNQQLTNEMRLTILLASAALLATASAADKVTIQRANGKRVSKSYIITLKKGADRDGKMGVAAQAADVQVTHEQWNPAVYNGFAGVFSDKAIEKMREDPSVEAIEEDVLLHAFATNTQTNAPWGLNRISQKAKPGNQNPGSLTFSYVYDIKAGSGTDIYVVDTGINTAHKDFGGRAKWGKTFGEYSNKDGNGHGTHVAGTAIGTRYGVAKKAMAYAVKCLDDDGEGSLSDVISGITWAVTRAQQTGRPSVINLSLGGHISSALDRAVTGAVSQGVHVVVAAGNENQDANNVSPARASASSAVIAVGASTIADKRAYFSNYGSPVAVFAPGQNITAAWIGSTTATKRISGTSMASPHVAGIVAYLISTEGQKTPSAMRSRILSLAQKNILSGLPSGTANVLAHNGVKRAPKAQ